MSQVTSLKGFRCASVGGLQLAVGRRQFSDKHLSTSIDMCRSRRNQGCAGERGVVTTRVAFSFSSATFFSTLDSKHQRGTHSLLLTPSLVAKHWLLLLMALVSNCRINPAVLITRLQKDPPEVGPKDCWSCWILNSSSCDPDVHVHVPSTFDLPAHSQLIPGRCLAFRTISLFKSPLPKLNCQERQAVGTGAPLWFYICYRRLVVQTNKDIHTCLPLCKGFCSKPGCSELQPIDVHCLFFPIPCSPNIHRLGFAPPSTSGRHLNELPVEMTWSFCCSNSLSWLSTNSTLGGLLGLAEL